MFGKNRIEKKLIKLKNQKLPRPTLYGGRPMVDGNLSMKGPFLMEGSLSVEGPLLMEKRPRKNHL